MKILKSAADPKVSGISTCILCLVPPKSEPVHCAVAQTPVTLYTGDFSLQVQIQEAQREGKGW